MSGIQSRPNLDVTVPSFIPVPPDFSPQRHEGTKVRPKQIVLPFLVPSLRGECLRCLLSRVRLNQSRPDTSVPTHGSHVRVPSRLAGDLSPPLVKKDPHHRRGSFSFPPGILAPTGQFPPTATLWRTHAKCPDLTRVPVYLSRPRGWVSNSVGQLPGETKCPDPPTHRTVSDRSSAGQSFKETPSDRSAATCHSARGQPRPDPCSARCARRINSSYAGKIGRPRRCSTCVETTRKIFSGGQITESNAALGT